MSDAASPGGEVRITHVFDAPRELVCSLDRPRAGRTLVGAGGTRHPGGLVSSRLTPVEGAPAVELVGDQTSLDRSTFQPIARSLRVTGEIDH